MAHIKTQWEIFRQIVAPLCDDVYDFLQLAQGGKENFLNDIECKFIDKQNEELTKYLNARLGGSWIKRGDLENDFIFWVEKNRWRLLDMWEMNDIYCAIESWARDNGYGYLYDD